MKQTAEYIWADGRALVDPLGTFNELRSKTRVLSEEIPVSGPVHGKDTDAWFPRWTYDGSSTGQAVGRDSDCVLVPVFACPDPVRGGNAVLVFCEVYTREGVPHDTNTRHRLHALVDDGVRKQDPWFGFEQEYVMMSRGRVFGWPDAGYPSPQGPFYCGVGADSVYGRALVEEHLAACMTAGLAISGVNAEVMPGQWEFQIGPVDIAGLDHIMVARYLLARLGEKHGVAITFDPKPVPGEWNGSGGHMNFSTASTRDADAPDAAIESIIAELGKTHVADVDRLGPGNQERATGDYETADLSSFSHGNSNRGASVRIPMQFGDRPTYFEDRRPAANADPYSVASVLVEATKRVE